MGRDNLDNAKHPWFGQSASPSEKREFSNDWKKLSNGWKTCAPRTSFQCNRGVISIENNEKDRRRM